MNDPTREDRIKPNPKYPGEWMVAIPGQEGGNRGFPEYESAVAYLQGLDDAVAERPVVPTTRDAIADIILSRFPKWKAAARACADDILVALACRVEQQQPTDAQVERVAKYLAEEVIEWFSPEDVFWETMSDGARRSAMRQARKVVAALGTTHLTEPLYGKWHAAQTAWMADQEDTDDR